MLFDNTDRSTFQILHANNNIEIAGRTAPGFGRFYVRSVAPRCPIDVESIMNIHIDEKLLGAFLEAADGGRNRVIQVSAKQLNTACDNAPPQPPLAETRMPRPDARNSRPC